MKLERLVFLLGCVLILIGLCGVAFADSGASSTVAGFDWKTIVGTLAGILGLGGAVDRLKARAAKWERAVLEAAGREARTVASYVKDKVLGGSSAFMTWEKRLETWVEKQGGKLPEPLRSKAIAEAHKVFHELHLYTDPMEEAAQQFGEALDSFQKALPEIEKQIASFPKPKAPSVPPPLKPAA